MTSDRLQRTALVCGGTRGLGLGIASAFSSEGLQVLCTSSSPPNGADGKTVFKLDFRDPYSIDGLIEGLQAMKLLPDIVVVNGPGPSPGYSDQVSAADWEDGFRILWGGPIRLVSMLLPAMKSRGWGRILWVTSVAAKSYMPGMAISTSLRSGLHGLVTTFSAEYAPFGITVNAIAPGYHLTDRLSKLGVPSSTLDTIPARRFGTAEEFGASAAFLASDRASYITGQVLVSDGGWSHGTAGR
ncbi:SDR family oxidoreductase [Acidovorax sp. D2M1]|uniref:SDR family oxidoreductase n=1 Tax=Acidovorax benzenivorans TaxID=2987520 RepID=A0ABT5S1Q5_9BURK|nr:SDR family oxidoreductase [Acidovorax benzenivorans]MDD2179063.1 SDR family oxidoreductase [Acidovorax benzenivorans]